MSIAQSSMESLHTVAVAMPSVLSEATVQFEHPFLAAGGLAVAGVSTWLGVRAGRAYDTLAETEVTQDLYPDPDMRDAAQDQYRREGRITKAAGLFVGVAAGAALANMAGPHTTQTEYKAHNVAIIVDAGADGRAVDVTDTNSNKQIARTQAGINSGLRFANDAGQEVNVEFIFAGSPAKSLGDVKGTEGKTDVVKAAEAYVGDLSTTADTDITGAFSLAEAGSAEQTIAITSNPDIATADSITAHPNNLTVIAPGKDGTTYEYLGTPHQAGYTATFGQKEAVIAQNTEQMQAAMNDVIDSSIKTTKDMPSTFYENIRNLAILGLAAGAATKFASRLTRRKH